MKITDVKIFVCSPGRNFVTVKIYTDQGLTGIGDATLNGREKAVVAYLEDHLVPLLIGRDAARIEDTWQYLYRGAYWRRGPVTMAAIAGIDMALWDIKAKAAGMPLYELLGGASRDRLMCYGHAQGGDIAEAVESVGALIDEGYRAVRVQSGIPGLPPVYGADGTSTNGAAENALPREELWSTSKYLRHAPKLFEAVREAHGWDVELLHDVHHRLTPIEAARLGKDLEPYRLFWLEDAVAAEHQEGFRLIRNHTTTPIAVGEVFNTIWDARLLIEEQLIDYIRMTSVHAGGITPMRRIADFAGLHNVRTGAHGAMDMSPICLASNIHLGFWVPNFGIQEYSGYSEETLEVFPGTWSMADGHLYPGHGPGHGVEFDEDLAERYPFERSYLPVNRLEDGTLWHW
ncbi:bifunctional D-altronate/D-mannonate dehydratase [Roseivivax halodurans JCM 10272]|uniref:Bifunctional D-altronate/D-mannonate dehydratase n=1 Tax=Roseivivax halodurans JCM 10272 TaxID=1449350 RepID=X7ELC9_9RHOB|nr:D-mannonate dehydratase ManD [Roseivivax halodurans]ETX15938.1 bifunctional D-altronate/D-mannonate dehydratase [Roseivivax halodurans JCM 10272]